MAAVTVGVRRRVRESGHKLSPELTRPFTPPPTFINHVVSPRRRFATTPLALAAAQTDLVTSVLVRDEEIIAARRHLWADHRLVVEHAAATALAGVHSPGGYVPESGEKVAVVLCGANTGFSGL